MTATVVLVHSPLVGPATWEATAAIVHGVVPSLVVASTGAPPHWPKQVAAVVDAVAGGRGPFLLVGHSGAGPLLPAIGAAVGDVAGYVFVDAGLPPPAPATRLALLPAPFAGRLAALRDGDGFLPPWHRWFPGVELPDGVADDRRLPWSLFTEELPVPEAWPDAPCGYVRLSAPYDDDAAEARRRGWPVVELDGHHLLAMTDPAAVAAAIGEVRPLRD